MIEEVRAGKFWDQFALEDMCEAAGAARAIEVFTKAAGMSMRDAVALAYLTGRRAERGHGDGK